MNMLSLILAIGTAITFLGGVFQAIVASIELARHSVQSKQKKRWLVVISTCIIFTILLGYASYHTSLSNPNDVVTPPIYNTPTLDSTIVPPATLTVSPTSIPTQPQKFLYHADSTTWSSGMSGWIGSSDWKTANGSLVNDGTVRSEYSSIGSMITAPYIPTTADYAIEAHIQFVGPSGSGASTDGFGLVGRNGNGQQGYTTWAHPDSGFYPGFIALSPISDVSPIYSTDSNTHKFNIENKLYDYRLELKGTDETFLLNGHKFFEMTDNSSLSHGQIGLVSNGCPISVSDFTVTAL